MIKVIKQDAQTNIARQNPHVRPRPHVSTVTATVKSWIAESRRDKVESDHNSRETIAGWSAET